MCWPAGETCRLRAVMATFFIGRVFKMSCFGSTDEAQKARRARSVNPTPFVVQSGFSGMVGRRADHRLSTERSGHGPRPIGVFSPMFFSNTRRSCRHAMIAFFAQSASRPSISPNVAFCAQETVDLWVVGCQQPCLRCLQMSHPALQLRSVRSKSNGPRQPHSLSPWRTSGPSGSLEMISGRQNVITRVLRMWHVLLQDRMRLLCKRRMRLQGTAAGFCVCLDWHWLIRDVVGTEEVRQVQLCCCTSLDADSRAVQIFG